jgi:chemotaxis signal transduction protein
MFHDKQWLKIMQHSWTVREIGIFTVKNFTFGVDASQIQELVQKRPVEFLIKNADDPSFVVVSYHKHPLPIFNLVAKWGIEKPPLASLSSPLTFLTFYRHEWLLACAVDAIENFISLPSIRSLQPVPELIIQATPHICVWGFYEMTDKLVPLIDLERVVTDEDIIQYQERIEPHEKFTT